METKKINIIHFILIQTLNKTIKLIEKKEVDFVVLLKDVLIWANSELDKNKTITGTQETAKQDIIILDKLVFALENIFEMFFEIAEKDEIKQIKKYYLDFIDKLNEYRNDLNIIANTDLWNEVDNIYNGKFNKNDYLTLPDDF